MRQRKVKIRDQLWTIRYTTRGLPKDSHGCAIWPDRVILIDPKLSHTQSRVTLVHELLHAVAFETNTKVTHRVINRIEYELTQALAQLGKALW